MALSADGTLALTGSYDGIGRLYNTSTGELLKQLKGHAREITSVALSADGTLALTGSSDRTARVWDAKSGSLFNTLLTGSLTSAVALSKDGKRALVDTDDNRIQLWDTNPLSGKNETSTPLTVLESHTDIVTAVAFDGDLIASGSMDKTVIIWKPIEYVTRK